MQGQIIIIGVILVFIILLAFLPIGKNVEASKEGAVLALKMLQDWTKWMAGIQTAALGGLGWLVFYAKSNPIEKMDYFEKGNALAAFIFIGLGLFIAALLLSALPSLALRIHSIKLSGDEELSAQYDIYEFGLYGWIDQEYFKNTSIKWVDSFIKCIKIRYIMNLEHWLWAAGLLSLGLHVMYSFWK